MEHKELSAEQGGVSGNYAVHDMISALQWTKENIKAFGGDATRVTIFGQSAGGTDIQYLSRLRWRRISSTPRLRIPAAGSRLLRRKNHKKPPLATPYGQSWDAPTSSAHARRSGRM